MATVNDHTARTENSQVLGKVGLWNLKQSEEFRDAPFPRAKRVKNLETLGMGEGLADLGMQSEDIRLGRVAHMRNTHTPSARECQQLCELPTRHHFSAGFLSQVSLFGR